VIGIVQGIFDSGVNQTVHWQADRKYMAKYNEIENKINI
jgi:hypothetical protein